MIPIPTNAVRASSASGVLAADLSATATTSFAIESGGSNFPSSDFEIEVGGEIILVGSRSGNTFSTLTRGHAGTAAVAHNNGDNVSHVISGTAIDDGRVARLVADVVELIGAGAPVDGTTGDDVAGTGSRYTDITAGVLYINTGVKSNPTWVKVGTQT